ALAVMLFEFRADLVVVRLAMRVVRVVAEAVGGFVILVRILIAVVRPLVVDVAPVLVLARIDRLADPLADQPADHRACDAADGCAGGAGDGPDCGAGGRASGGPDTGAARMGAGSAGDRVRIGILGCSICCRLVSLGHASPFLALLPPMNRCKNGAAMCGARQFHPTLLGHANTALIRPIRTRLKR